jgi:hypothetical protein
LLVEQGLTVAFVESMTTQLQNFPAPPGPTDPYWYVLPISPPFLVFCFLFYLHEVCKGG